MIDGRIEVRTIEMFGAISGRLAARFSDRAAILAEAGLDEAAWETAVRVFRGELAAAEASRDANGLIAKYRAAFATRDATVAMPKAQGAPLPGLDASALDAAPMTAPEPQRAIAVPSYLKNPRSEPTAHRSPAPTAPFDRLYALVSQSCGAA